MIVVNVIRGSRQPYSFNGIYYIRQHNNSVSVNSSDLSLLIRTSNGYDSSWEKMTTINAELENLDMAEVDRTIQAAEQFKRGKALPQRREDFLNYF